MKLSLSEEELEVVLKALPEAEPANGSLIYEVSTSNPSLALADVKKAGDAMRKLGKLSGRI